MAALFAIYINGDGVAKDEQKAAYWCERAAEGGNVACMGACANFHLQGIGVKRDPAKAASWFRKAADAGNADSMRCLGFMYFTGQGVAEDHEQGVKWLRRGAEAGDVTSIDCLGQVYLFHPDELVPQRQERVFLVFVTDEWVAYNWYWYASDAAQPTLPDGHSSRFDRRLL